MCSVSRGLRAALWCLLVSLAVGARGQGEVDLPALFERLADPAATAAAYESLTRLRAQAGGSWLAAARRDPAPLLAAIERGRNKLGAEPSQARAWFECEVASALVDFGLRKSAATLLQTYLGVDDRATPRDARWLRAQALVLQADIALLASDYTTAEAAAERASQLAEALLAEASEQRAAAPTETLAQLQALRADTLGLRARAFIQLGVLKRADELVRAQRDAARVSGDAVALDRACQVGALYLLAREQAGRAVQLVREYRAGLRGRVASSTLDVVELLAEVAANAGRADAAAASVSRMRELLARPGLPIDLHVQAELACARVDLAAGAKVAAHAGIARARALAGELGDPVILGDVEALASRVLRATGATTDEQRAVQLRSLQQSFAALVEDWRRAPLREDGISFLASRARRALVGELLSLTLVTDDAAARERAVEDLLCLQQLGSSAREQSVPPASLAEVRDVLLGERDGVLLWQVSEAQTHVFAVDRAGIVHVVQPGRNVVAPALDQLMALLASVGVAGQDAAVLTQRLREQAQAVGDLFLPPAVIARVSTWRHVIVADHGLPAGLPLECLTVAGMRDDLLGERFAIATLSSLPVGVHWQRTRHRVTPRAAAQLQLIASLVGDPGRPVDQRVPDFPVERATALFAPYAHADRLCDGQATPTAVHLAGAKPTVVHFVAHGAEDRRRARIHGLALTPPSGEPERGFFGCAEVEARAWSGLVILSACGVGRPMKRVGEESYLGTLGGAFLRAGAHTVIQSAAELPFATHLDLCERLHAGLVAGLSPAEALRAARAADRSKAWLVRVAQGLVSVQGLGHRNVIE